MVIPTLNEEKFLPSLLTDLSLQSFKNFEVIVVDACSSDKTLEEAHTFRKMLTIRTKKVNTKNVSYQRNVGAALAKGSYIVFLDADSRVKKEFLKNIRRYTVKYSKLLILPRIYPQDADDISPDKHVYPLLNSIVAWSQMTSKPFSTGGSMILERHFFAHLGGFNPKMVLSEDHDVVHRARSAGVNAIVPKDIHVYISLRRFHKEGRLHVYIKYVRIALKTMQSGGITEAPFDYSMGGAPEVLLKKQNGLDDLVKSYLDKVRKTFPAKF